MAISYKTHIYICLKIGVSGFMETTFPQNSEVELKGHCPFIKLLTFKFTSCNNNTYVSLRTHDLYGPSILL